jgi:hypothetical protein
MLREKALGVDLVDIVQRFSVQYEVSEKAIYQDWERRAKWANEVVELDDPEGFVAELHDILNWVKRRAVLTALQAEQESSKLGAFKLLLDIVKTHFTIAQATGKIKTVEGLDDRDILVSAWNLGTADTGNKG